MNQTLVRAAWCGGETGIKTPTWMINFSPIDLKDVVMNTRREHSHFSGPITQWASELLDIKENIPI